MEELTLPFLDARKRVAHYPDDLSHRVRLAAVPTTAGTGSEVSPAAVITVDGVKATLVDYSLVPDVAIVEPRLTLSMPPTVTADTGVDALTHALEAAVSVFASPFTDAFCMQAVNLILDALPRAYENGDDLEARADMANAATIAGLAFSNAFVGVCHALAHPVGARFGIAHGRANAIFLPHVLRYNAQLPSKFMPSPGVGTYAAPGKYAQMSFILGLGGRGPGGAPAPPLRARRRAAGRGRHAALPAGARSRRARVRACAARPGEGRLRGPEPAHQPAHPAHRRAARPAARGLRRALSRGFPAVGRAVSADAPGGPRSDPRCMDNQESFKPPKRSIELIVDSFWIAALFAIAFYVFGVVIGVISPGSVVGLTVTFVVLCALWAGHSWRAHRLQAYRMRDPRLHRDRERRGY